MSKIFVLGSINADTFLQVGDFVQPGETITATAVEHAAGGKGLNQAVAAARMGADVIMIGAVGQDVMGKTLLDALERDETLDVSRVLRVGKVSTSQAFVQVDGGRENAIVVAPGANQANSVESLDGRLDDLGPDDLLICQLEIPTQTVAQGLAMAKARGARTVLNAAPAAAVSDLLSDVDLLVVNESEAATMLGGPAARPAEALHRRFGVSVVVTLGSQGSYVRTEDTDVALPALPVAVVDTTGAGDAFVGGLAAALSAGQPITEAAQFGTALAASACGAAGAQGYPQRKNDIEEMVHAMNKATDTL